MCLALPARIEEKEGDEAWVVIGDSRLRASLVMTPAANVGDWVLVHAGFAIQQVTDEDALRTWDIYREVSTGESV